MSPAASRVIDADAAEPREDDQREPRVQRARGYRCGASPRSHEQADDGQHARGDAAADRAPREVALERLVEHPARVEHQEHGREERRARTPPAGRPGSTSGRASSRAERRRGAGVHPAGGDGAEARAQEERRHHRRQREHGAEQPPPGQRAGSPRETRTRDPRSTIPAAASASGTNSVDVIAANARGNAGPEHDQREDQPDVVRLPDRRHRVVDERARRGRRAARRRRSDPRTRRRSRRRRGRRSR